MEVAYMEEEEGQHNGTPMENRLGSSRGPQRLPMFSPRSTAAMALSSFAGQHQPTPEAFQPPPPATIPRRNSVQITVSQPKAPSRPQRPLLPPPPGAHPAHQGHYSGYSHSYWQPYDPRMPPMPPPNLGPHGYTSAQGPSQPRPSMPTHFYSGPPPSQVRRSAPQSFVTPTPKKLRLLPTTAAQHASRPSTPKTEAYSRKKKSLGVLAETFCRQFATQPPSTEIIIDVLASQLGVERRRIYDVVNILEAVQLVRKKGKSTYCWMGSEHLPQMFAILQREALNEYADDALAHGLLDELPAPLSTPAKKDVKSLSRLSQHFLQVFLVGAHHTSLPDASDKIHGAASTPHDLAVLGSKNELVPDDPKKFQQAAARGLKTKIRRLYDIANVFLSIGVLSKTDEKITLENGSTTKRPLYAWAYTLSPKELLDLYESLPDYMKETGLPFRRLDTPPATVSASSTPPAKEDEEEEPLLLSKHVDFANIHQMGGAVDDHDDDDDEVVEGPRRVSLPEDVL